MVRLGNQSESCVSVRSDHDEVPTRTRDPQCCCGLGRSTVSRESEESGFTCPFCCSQRGIWNDTEKGKPIASEIDESRPTEVGR